MKKVILLLFIAIVSLMSCETQAHHIKHQSLEPDALPVRVHEHISNVVCNLEAKGGM